MAQAYPDLLVAAQEELAAEAFLRGYKNPRVAYQAMNSNPQTSSQCMGAD